MIAGCSERCCPHNMYAGTELSNFLFILLERFWCILGKFEAITYKKKIIMLFKLLLSKTPITKSKSYS